MSITVKLDGVDITAQLNAQALLQDALTSISPADGGKYDLMRVIGENDSLKNKFFNTNRHRIDISRSGGAFLGTIRLGSKYSSRNR